MDSEKRHTRGRGCYEKILAPNFIHSELKAYWPFRRRQCGEYSPANPLSKPCHVITYQLAASTGKKKIESSADRFDQLVFHTVHIRTEKQNKRATRPRSRVCARVWSTYHEGQAMGVTFSRALLYF